MKHMGDYSNKQTDCNSRAVIHFCKHCQQERELTVDSKTNVIARHKLSYDFSKLWADFLYSAEIPDSYIQRYNILFSFSLFAKLDLFALSYYSHYSTFYIFVGLDDLKSFSSPTACSYLSLLYIWFYILF